MQPCDHDYQQILKIKPQDIVVDIGTAEGCSAIQASKIANLVIAIEPNPKYIGMLQSQIIQQNITNIIMVDKATWNKKELKELKLEDWSSHILGLETTLIQADTLDNIIRELGFNYANFITMDIEGAEIETLEGAEHTLLDTEKIVIAGYHSRKDLNLKETCYWVENYLNNKGFNTTITQDKLVHGYKKYGTTNIKT